MQYTEYIEYLIVVLIIALALVLYFHAPKKVINIVLRAVVDFIRQIEAELVKGLYNRLPASLKAKVGSEQVAFIVEQILDMLIDVLEEAIVEVNVKK